MDMYVNKNTLASRVESWFKMSRDGEHGRPEKPMGPTRDYVIIGFNQAGAVQTSEFHV